MARDEISKTSELKEFSADVMSTLPSCGEARQASTPHPLQVHLDSSCKPEKIVNIFSLFEYEKVTLVRGIGFGGLLQLPRFELNLDLCLWLLQRFDYKHKTLHLPGGVELPVRLEDVYLVLGIPFEGRSLLLDFHQTKDKISAFIDRNFSRANVASLTLPFIENILQKEYGLRMTDPERDMFIIATMLYAVTYLLAPEADEDFPTKVVQNLLANIKLLQINWATLVLWSLHRASVDAVQKLDSGCNNITILGCCLFLQVFYIDNLNFGPPAPNHTYLPRTAAYWPDLLRDLILSDATGSSSVKLTQFGKTGLRPNYAVGYTRAWMDELEQPSQDFWCMEILYRGIRWVDEVPLTPSHGSELRERDFLCKA